MGSDSGFGKKLRLGFPGMVKGRSQPGAGYTWMLFLSACRQLMFSEHQVAQFPIKLEMGGKIFPGVSSSPSHNCGIQHVW